jgi:sugar phosphate isomerase/epimerase
MSLSEGERENRALIDGTEKFRVELRPVHVIFHPGLNGDIFETIRQLRLFKVEYPALFNLALIENKPKIGLKGEACIGSSPEEIKRIVGETGLGFCLDVGHAINYSAWACLKYFDILDIFQSLKPKMYHLSDGDFHSEKDVHLNFGKGNFDLPYIIKKIPWNARVTIETEKDPSLNLSDFEEDVRFYGNAYER